MKTIIAFLAVLSLISPAYAAAKSPPTDEQKQEWRDAKEAYRADKDEWKANGKPDPKPERPSQPW